MEGARGHVATIGIAAGGRNEIALPNRWAAAANHLPPGMETLFPGFGNGLGVGVCVSPAESGDLGSVGQFGRGGAATTWVIIDPEEGLAALVFAQHMPSDCEFTNRLTTLVCQAIVE